MSGTNVLYIGQKPLMNYVLAAGRRREEGGSALLIQARGRSISKAVDVALITLDRANGGSMFGEIEKGT